MSIIVDTLTMGTDVVITKLNENTYLASFHLSGSDGKQKNLEDTQFYKIVEALYSVLDENSIAVLIGDYNVASDEKTFHVDKVLDKFEGLYRRHYFPTFATSNKMRNITNQLDKALDRVEKVIDYAVVISRQELNLTRENVFTMNLHGPLDHNESYEVQYPSDHHMVRLDLNGDIYMTLNCLGESMGKEFRNFWEFIPAKYMNDSEFMEKLREAHKQVDESEEFREFIQEGWRRIKNDKKDKKDKDKNIGEPYNKIFRNDKVFDVHFMPDELLEDQEYEKYQQDYMKEYDNFYESKHSEEDKDLGTVFLNRHQKIINHPLVKDYFIEMMKEYKNTPKLSIPDVIKRYPDADYFCLQEITKDLIGLIQQDDFIPNEYDIFVTNNDGNSTILVEDYNFQLKELKENKDTKQMEEKNAKTFGVILKRKNLYQAERMYF